jgi:prepilin-type N-terminal cleavage/methylation domain-containing protein
MILPPANRRRGFTLIELLVVIAIIAILVALLLPAVQQVREAARKSQCQDHLHNIAIAMHSYEGAIRVFPFSTITRWNGASGILGSTSNSRQSWFHMILPFVEQKPLYDKYKVRIERNEFPGGWPLGERDAVVDLFMCPTDPENPKVTNQGFHGNYLPCHGSTAGGANNTHNPTNGWFFPLSSVDMTDVKDGTSNTIMFGEIKLVMDGTTPDPGQSICGSPHDLRGRYHNPYHGNITFTTMRPPNTPVGDLLQYCRGTNAVPCRGCVSGPTELHARSWHAGGVQFGLGDGKVTMISENVDQNLFRALGTIKGGETARVP